jgi:hypothetical protein
MIHLQKPCRFIGFCPITAICPLLSAFIRSPDDNSGYFAGCLAAVRMTLYSRVRLEGCQDLKHYSRGCRQTTDAQLKGHFRSNSPQAARATPSPRQALILSTRVVRLL